MLQVYQGLTAEMQGKSKGLQGWGQWLPRPYVCASAPRGPAEAGEPQAGLTMPALLPDMGSASLCPRSDELV